MQMYDPPHPGELLKEWLTGLDLSVTEMAAHIKLSRNMLSRLVHCHSTFTADIDLRLHDALGTEKGFWLKLQQNYDLWQAENKAIRPVIEPIIRQAA